MAQRAILLSNVLLSGEIRPANSALLVAIPALAFHRYFRGRVTGYVMEMEKEATALVDLYYQ